MALSNSQYDKIIRSYEDRQTKNRHILEERTNHVYQAVDGYRALCESIASISVSQGKKLLEGDENALRDLKETLERLSDMKKQLLQIGRAHV